MPEPSRGLPPLVPLPAEISPGAGIVGWPEELSIAAPPALQAHAAVVAAELNAVSGRSARPALADRGFVEMALDDSLGEEEYGLQIGAGRVSVAARDPEGAARATATMLQLAGPEGLPELSVRDRPAFPYRGLLVDCARHFQPIPVLEQMVELCRFYKVRYLQLHLTDHESFTFPSRIFPRAPTPGRSYRRQELIDLDRFAAARGVGLVPEIDVPGHSRALVAAYPDVFGLDRPDANPELVGIGRQAAREGIDALLGELCEVFASSPYVHVGGDEADLHGLAEDPSARARMAGLGLAGPEELFAEFVGSVHRMVAARGRRTLVWEGFRRGTAVRVPADVTVLAWDGAFYRPDLLVEDGYPVVNASWQPLYIVGGGGDSPRMWPPAHIHRWHPRRFEHYEPRSPAFGGLELPGSAPVLGGQMCIWEQRAHTTLRDARPRLPVFAERSWNPAGGDFAGLQARLAGADRVLESLLR